MNIIDPKYVEKTMNYYLGTNKKIEEIIELITNYKKIDEGSGITSYIFCHIRRVIDPENNYELIYKFTNKIDCY